MRVTPRVWIGLAVWAGYVLIILVVSLMSGVPFTDIGTSADSTWRGAVLDLAVGAVFLIIVTAALGWWRPALTERRRSRHRWPIFVPILMLVGVLINVVTTDWSQFDASFLLSLAALGILVGFNEELMARGLLLTGLRPQVREAWVWFITSALFGGMHLINALLGAPLGGALAQAGLAFASGTAFYIVRRVTGSLIGAMVLHGLWDVSVFASGHAPLGPALGSLLGPIVGVLALATVYWVIKGTDERPVLT
ncbi:CPBP family intramembrane glutamic endopeptidase [Microbacterium sp. NPDC089189]|uniref:CPBP family intramembrane glutamic endopeptidase n=1 Tax=Microbacterium sp. NPDC089189 TaxID=3154972 RepID=UPI003426E0CD